MEKKLNELGVKYGTDKSSLLHDYLVEYEKEFPEPEKVEKVVELGLQRLNKKWRDSKLPSVNMWLEFFPNAHVYGFDKQDIKSSDRFSFFKGDQGRIKDHMEFGGKVNSWDIDFVIDDCSHRPTHQLLSLLYLFPRLKTGGVYIIEDTNALVQKDYAVEMRATSAIEPYLEMMDCTYRWIESKSAGEKSSLIIRKS